MHGMKQQANPVTGSSKTATLRPSLGDDWPDRLSNREREILALAAEGFLDKEIGPRLSITENTLKTYWNRIRGKLGGLARSQLVSAYVLFEFEKEISSPNAVAGDRYADWIVDLPNWTWKRVSDRKLPADMAIGVDFDLEQLLNMIHSDDRPQMRALLDSVMGGTMNDFVYQMRMVTPEGVVPAGAFVRVVRNEKGEVVQLLGHHCRQVFNLSP